MHTSKINWYSFFIFKRVYFILMGMLGTLLLSAALGGILPFLIAELSDKYYAPSYDFVVLKILILFIATYFNRFLYQLFVQNYMRATIRNLRTSIFHFWVNGHEVLKGDQEDSSLPKGEFMARIMSDAEALRELVTSGVFGLFIDLFFVLSAFVAMIRMDHFLGGSIFIVELLVSLLLIWGSRYMRKVFMEIRTERGKLSSILANISGGFEESYYIDHGEYASKKGEDIFRSFLKVQLRVNLWDSFYYSLAESLYPIFLAFFIVIFPHSHVTSVAIVLAILDLIQRSIEPIKSVSGKIASIQRAVTGMIRVQDFFDKMGKKSDYSLNEQFILQKGFKEFSVYIPSFEYPTAKVRNDDFKLKDICFKIKKGEVFGIAGLSGSGKSTLLKILSGDIVAEGSRLSLCFDNYNLDFPTSNTLSEYKSYVSIVSQESHIFSESLLFNITMNDIENENFQQFWSDITSEIPFLRGWRYSKDDMICDGELSSGEKQLVASLRACFLKKELVLLDEVSSALDSKLELALRAVIMRIQRYSVTVVVAHRLETIMHAHTILMMNEGSIVASGTHNELANTSVFYGEFLKELK